MLAVLYFQLIPNSQSSLPVMLLNLIILKVSKNFQQKTPWYSSFLDWRATTLLKVNWIKGIIFLGIFWHFQDICNSEHLRTAASEQYLCIFTTCFGHVFFISRGHQGIFLTTHYVR